MVIGVTPGTTREALAEAIGRSLQDVTKMRGEVVLHEPGTLANDGKVIDDGTLFQLDEERYRLCAQHHQLDWLLLSADGFDVDVASPPEERGGGHEGQREQEHGREDAELPSSESVKTGSAGDGIHLYG